MLQLEYLDIGIERSRCAHYHTHCGYAAAELRNVGCAVDKGIEQVLPERLTTRQATAYAHETDAALHQLGAYLVDSPVGVREQKDALL